MRLPKSLSLLIPLTLFFSMGADATDLPTIKEVRYEGLNYISPLIANEIAKVQVGKPLDINRVDASVRDFYAQGYFKDIWITEEEGILTYHFIEKPVIASLIISGYGAGKEQQQLDKEIGLKKGDVYDENKIASVRRQIVRLLETQGFYNSVVEVKTEEITTNALKVTLEINKGENIIIQKANYYGRDNISISRIEAATANKEKDFIGWMWGFNNGKLQINELEADSLRIRDVYLQKGYLDADVSAPFLKTDFTTYDAVLDYHINEGERYRVSEVEIILEEDVIELEKLYDELKLEKGKVYNVSKMRQDIESIRYKIGDLGYAFVRVTPDLDKKQESGEVRLIYYVQPGGKVRVKDVVISGNSKTLDRVVRRNILLAPGEEYMMSKIKRSKNMLMRTGSFESVDIQEERVDEENINLLVKVKEGKTGEFAFGVGYGSYDGLMGSVSIKDRNIFGTGLTAGVYLDKSEVSTAYRLNLFNPAVFDSEYSLGTDVYKSDYENYDYKETSTGFSVVGGRNIWEDLDLTLGYTYQKTKLSNFNSKELEDLYRRYYYSGTYVKSSVIPGFSYDNTDAYLFAKNGIRVLGNIEYAGVGGDAEFIKYYGSYNYYKSIEEWVDIDLIFRYRARAGYVQSEGYLPISEKFYLGGINSVRGYESRSITPRDKFGLRIGGKQFFYNTVELSYNPFEIAQMRFTGFYDYGMIGNRNVNDMKRSSVGVGIEWISPIGVVNFIFPYALDKKRGDETSSFEFSMGQRF
ncbi:outer membrane protein assembly factor BamA [Helicobacter turcicus]|uniref:Outer membrane protein assembly factor BamA n=1 Tax=Helicobacter turcicus TaxID=2867412 RepID=A0ABS7JLZ6_9HELI|nr:outer membrane protein assembly factor BamA [Helicobacter turcicus]MBX7490417.1 outer membrane protein assembly factor BamA [Helicobacter turcicus]MBX7545275.1 outer membrane protein assembly factor BamA [Helicobacter turcicus]